MAISDEQLYLPPQTDWITGDKITDPAWLKWYHSIGNLHKSIKFVDVIGDLDDISDGTTYGRVNITQIDASGIVVLSQVSGDLDDIDDGDTYSKVLKTDISAGHILLSESVGDLDDIDDGSNYGKVALTSISSGKIIIAGLDQDVIDSYGPIISDPTFALTADNTDTSFWEQTSAAKWSATYGENGPGLRIIGNSSNNDLLVNDGQGGTRFVPASQNDKFFVQIRIQVDADFDSDVQFRMTSVDETKSGLSTYTKIITPSTDSVWETISVQLQATDSDTNFVYFRVRVPSTATTGYAYIDSIQVVKEPEANFRHASNVTEIDGGTIRTRTILGDSISLQTQLSINDATFGNDGIQLDYNSGTPRIYVGDGSTSFMQFISGTSFDLSGVDINLLTGNDISLTAADSNPSKIILNDTGAGTNHFNFSRDATYDRLCIYPDTANAGLIYFGMKEDANLHKWAGIKLHSYGSMSLQCNYDSTYDGEIEFHADSDDAYIDIRVNSDQYLRFYDSGIVTSGASDYWQINCDLDLNGSLDLTGDITGGTLNLSIAATTGVYSHLLENTGNLAANNILKLNYPDDVASGSDRAISCFDDNGIVWNINGDGTHDLTSERSIKENIEPYPSVLDKVPLMQIWRYNRKGDKNKIPMCGFMAEELREILPEFTSIDPDSGKILINQTLLTNLMFKIFCEFYNDRFLPLEKKINVR